MKIKDLRKILDNYVASHSEDDEVILEKSFYSTLDHTKKFDLIELKQENIISSNKIAVKHEFVKNCGYSDECIPPSGVARNNCRYCPEGGVGHYISFELDETYGTPVLAIKV